jgi:hypothetical protein
MAKAKELSITLTTLEANEIMRMLDDDMESCFVFGTGIDLDNWESLDLTAHKYTSGTNRRNRGRFTKTG